MAYKFRFYACCGLRSTRNWLSSDIASGHKLLNIKVNSDCVLYTVYCTFSLGNMGFLVETHHLHFPFPAGNCECKRKYDNNGGKSCYRPNTLPKLLPGLISTCVYCLRMLEVRHACTNRGKKVVINQIHILGLSIQSNITIIIILTQYERICLFIITCVAHILIGLSK